MNIDSFAFLKTLEQRVGLAKEHFMVAVTSVPMIEEVYTHEIPVIAPVPEPAQKPAVSQSFLKNLVGFLRNKTA